jgi:hypothetical protein
VADASAARENHGDLVVADALSWKMVKESSLLSHVTKRVEAARNQWDDPRTFAGRFRMAERERGLEEAWD